MKKSLGAKTLLYPMPVWVIGSYDENNRPNAMTASWTGICCSKPPCVYVSVRRMRYSYENILNKKSFTINIPSSKYIKQCDYLGTRSGKNENKFESTGLTPIKSDLVDAPYIKEFPMVIECKLIKDIDLGTHTQFIGEIVDVKCDEEFLNEKNVPILKDVDPFIYTPELGDYYSIGNKLAKAYGK